MIKELHKQPKSFYVSLSRNLNYFLTLTLPGLDCDGEYGYDSARACQKMEVRKTIDGGYESTASFCFATDSTCSNKQFVAFNETLNLRGPGVLLGHYFDGISETPRVSF